MIISGCSDMNAIRLTLLGGTDIISERKDKGMLTRRWGTFKALATAPPACRSCGDNRLISSMAGNWGCRAVSS